MRNIDRRLPDHARHLNKIEKRRTNNPRRAAFLFLNV
jgi:hypothetical protein